MIKHIRKRSAFFIGSLVCSLSFLCAGQISYAQGLWVSPNVRGAIQNPNLSLIVPDPLPVKLNTVPEKLFKENSEALAKNQVKRTYEYKLCPKFNDYYDEMIAYEYDGTLYRCGN